MVSLTGRLLSTICCLLRANGIVIDRVKRWHKTDEPGSTTNWHQKCNRSQPNTRTTTNMTRQAWRLKSQPASRLGTYDPTKWLSIFISELVVVTRSDQPKPPAVAIVRQNGLSSTSCRASATVTPMSWQIWWIQVVGGRPLARLHSCKGRSPSLALVQIRRTSVESQINQLIICEFFYRKKTVQNTRQTIWHSVVLTNRPYWSVSCKSVQS